MRYRDKAVHARNPEVLVAGRRRLAIVAAVVLVVLLAVGGWFLARCLRSSQSQAGQGATTQMDVAKQKKHVVKKAEPKEHHGNSPDCPDTDCIAMMVNGDLLFHPGLWGNFAGPNTAATDGTAYDFDPSVRADAQVHRCLRYRGVRIRNARSRLAAAPTPRIRCSTFRRKWRTRPANVGYQRLHTRHQPFLDQGADGIARLWDTLRGRRHRPDGLVQDRSRLYQTAGHRFSDRWRQAGSGHRYRLPERHDPRR